MSENTAAADVKVIDYDQAGRLKLLMEFKEKPRAAIFQIGCFAKSGLIDPRFIVDGHEIFEQVFYLYLTPEVWRSVQAEVRPEGKSLLALVAEKAEAAYNATGRDLLVSRIARCDHFEMMSHEKEEIRPNPLTGDMVDLRYGKMYDFTHLFV